MTDMTVPPDDDPKRMGPSGEEDPERLAEAQLEHLLEYLRSSRGFDFTDYKRPGLARRIRKRLGALGLHSFDSYRDYLEVHPQEFTQLFNTVLINVTSFFRDTAAWDYIREEIVPRLATGGGPETPIRVWSAGVASGEEAYTAAIVLAEVLGEEQYTNRVKIYATDVDEEALVHARQATYTAREMANVPPDLLAKYFEGNQSGYVFSKNLRRAVIFGRHDLLQDAPISRVNLLICRNTLMYFNAEAQSRILSRFHFALDDQGILFLGRAEMLFAHSNLFRPVEPRRRIFAKVVKGNSLHWQPVVSLTLIDVTSSHELQETLAQTNQELETAYEEAQATNEELETMNEELQSTNEEMDTLNHELHLRTDELREVNVFLESVLGSLRSAVVVLDRDLRVRVWNSQATDFWGLRADEVSGQHFMNLDIGLPVGELRAALRACLLGEMPYQELYVTATNRRGKENQYKISCAALQNGDKGISGVSLTMQLAHE